MEVCGWREISRTVLLGLLVTIGWISSAACLKCYTCDVTSPIDYEKANEQCNRGSLQDCPEPRSGACMIETYRKGSSYQMVKQCLHQCPVFVNTTAELIRCCMEDACNNFFVTKQPPGSFDVGSEIPSNGVAGGGGHGPILPNPANGHPPMGGGGGPPGQGGRPDLHHPSQGPPLRTNPTRVGPAAGTSPKGNNKPSPSNKGGKSGGSRSQKIGRNRQTSSGAGAAEVISAVMVFPWILALHTCKKHITP